MGQPRLLFHLFSVFTNKQYNFTTNQCEKCHVHPVYGARIWTHNLSNMSCLPYPLERLLLLGEILSLLIVYLVFGKILNQLWQLLEAIGQIWIVVNGQISSKPSGSGFIASVLACRQMQILLLKILICWFQTNLLCLSPALLWNLREGARERKKKFEFAWIYIFIFNFFPR